MEASELDALITRAVLLSVAKKTGGLTGDLASRLGRAGGLANIAIEAGAAEPLQQAGEAVEKTLKGLGGLLKGNE